MQPGEGLLMHFNNRILFDKAQTSWLCILLLGKSCHGRPPYVFHLRYHLIISPSPPIHFSFSEAGHRLHSPWKHSLWEHWPLLTCHQPCLCLTLSLGSWAMCPGVFPHLPGGSFPVSMTRACSSSWIFSVDVLWAPVLGCVLSPHSPAQPYAFDSILLPR